MATPPPCSDPVDAALRCSFKKTTKGFKAYDWLAFFIPAFGWLRTYNVKGWLYRDLLAGLSVAVMVIPQGMSYAQNLAYLPQVYGTQHSGCNSCLMPAAESILIIASMQVCTAPLSPASCTPCWALPAS